MLTQDDMSPLEWSPNPFHKKPSEKRANTHSGTRESGIQDDPGIKPKLCFTTEAWL